MKAVAKKRVSVAVGASGDRTHFYRELAWRLGDEHARRICRWVDFYCRLFGVDPTRFHLGVPR